MHTSPSCRTISGRIQTGILLHIHSTWRKDKKHESGAMLLDMTPSSVLMLLVGLGSGARKITGSGVKINCAPEP
jgi:hypothetical protein